MTDTRQFDGTLVTVPFGPGTLTDVVAEQYRSLLETHDSEDVLVVTGSPTSQQTVRDALADELPGSNVPRVTSLVVHATDVLNWHDDRTILSDALRRELLHRFLEARDWEAPYLARASEQTSFEGDAAQLLETASWQDATFDATPELAELGGVLEEFHEWLAEHDHLERGQLVSEAATVLETGGGADELVQADAVLVAEFEEFFPLDRRYLAALAEDRELVCVAEEHASVRRTWMETGPITEHVSFANEERAAPVAPERRPAATAAYFARGEAVPDPQAGAVRVLSAPTPDDQLERVEDEIEHLRESAGWAYDDIAVALGQSGEAVDETVRALRRAGIPTESTSVTGFGDDPAVRELLCVVRWLAADDAGDTNDASDADEAGDTNDADREELAADSTLDEATLSRVEQTDGLEDALRHWATESDLKARIAADADALDARARFGNVRRVFRMAAFVEETGFVEASWPSFESMLERAHEHAPTHTQTSATNRDGGVRVDHVQALKNADCRAVFVLNVVDGAYPGQAGLTRLFPEERVAAMPDYPGVTQVDADDVEATFPTDSTASSRAFRRYHTEHARRRLAVAAATATDRLYVCLYRHEDSALDERAQPSRFLTEAYDELPWVEDGATATDTTPESVASERAAEEYVLSRVDRALADVRSAHSQRVDVSLDGVEAEFAAIQRLLDDSGERGDDLREALRARRDFARGRVRRD